MPNLEKLPPCKHEQIELKSGTLGGDYTKCLICGLEQQRSLHDIHSRFTDAQVEWYGATDPACLSPFALSLSAEDAKYRLQILKSASPKGRLLEIGPGSGQFAELAKTSGYDVFAIEDSEVLVNAVRSRGIEVQQGTFESLNLEPDFFDIVVNWHVIEHVLDPVSFLEQAARVTKPGGIMILGTPNAASLEHKIAGRHSPNYSKAHLRLFTPASLIDLLPRAGWEPKETFTTDEPEHWLRVLAGLLSRTIGHLLSKRSDAPKPDITASALAVQNVNASLGMALIFVTRLFLWPLRRMQNQLGKGNEAIAVARRL